MGKSVNRYLLVYLSTDLPVHLSIERQSRHCIRYGCWFDNNSVAGVGAQAGVAGVGATAIAARCAGDILEFTIGEQADGLFV